MTKNDHQITLSQALIPPRKILVIDRSVLKGRVKDRQIEVWLVGQENREDGYQIVMSDDDLVFGLASKGFPADAHPILCGWYGDLMAAFLGM